jgi:hypothetical protein
MIHTFKTGNLFQKKGARLYTPPLSFITVYFINRNKENLNKEN